MSAKLIYKPSQKIKNVCSRTNRFDNLYGLIHYKKIQIKIYKFVGKDNRQNPYILTLSNTLLGILQNQSQTMNLIKAIQSNRPFCTGTKYRIKQTSWVKLTV